MTRGHSTHPEFGLAGTGDRESRGTGRGLGALLEKAEGTIAANWRASGEAAMMKQPGLRGRIDWGKDLFFQ